MASSHSYEEPSLTAILVLVGFILLLNGVYKALDSFLYCGLVGQVFVGVLFGTPGTKLLSNAVETTISDLGYLGLILLVYQGGLSTSLSGVISSSTLSLLVALTGILLPIALSFLLLPLGASPLQCFSAGAALSATSLGTAFATLSTSGLLNTHVGTVLTSAAMLDDVVGLIMLQVVAELSSGHGTASDYGKVVGKALGASLGLVGIVVVICRLALRPLYNVIRSWTQSPKRGQLVKAIWEGPYIPFTTHTTLLLGLVVSGSYAGTSLLLAAFVAGVVVRWSGDEVTHSNGESRVIFTVEPGESQVVSSPAGFHSGLQVYERYYGPSAERILKPFFFASIGFSIPITQMFHASTVWKGLVYTLLMFLGKLATGLWLVPSSLEAATRSQISRSAKWSKNRKRAKEKEPKVHLTMPNGTKPEAKPTEVELRPETVESSPPAIPTSESIPMPAPTSDAPMPNIEGPHVDGKKATPSGSSQSPGQSNDNPAALSTSQTQNTPPPSSSPPPGPPEKRALRAHAPALLGLAMTARGEIGFLIASVAESRGIFSSTFLTPSPSTDGVESTSELYLVAVWAIVLCTVIGPVVLGGFVRRVKRLELQEKN